jgi:hypothetical protein
MILGVSHVTLLSKNIKTDGNELQKLGYSMFFVEENVVNNKGKYGFLACPSSCHSLALYQHENGTPVELIMYDNFVNRFSPCFKALFDAPIPEGLRGKTNKAQLKYELDDVLNCNAFPFSWETFETEIWFTGNAISNNGLKALILFVKDLDIAQKFWERGLGCKPLKRGGVETGRMWAVETFKSPFKAWKLDVILAEGACAEPKATLDSAGFNCLALLTTNLKSDRLRLLSTSAANSTGEFELKMNNKNLMVEVFRGPDGEFIELLQIKSVC